MRYLVDTNVIFAVAPTIKISRPVLAQWMDANSQSLFVSVVTIAEITDGITKARREGAVRKAVSLSDWLQHLLHLYGGRMLVFDLAAAQVAGILSDLARSRGHAPDFPDIAIAATARLHDLTILSRNVRHFVPMDVIVIDPFAALPASE
jgi:predicted nucleic acid-binding protein